MPFGILKAITAVFICFGLPSDYFQLAVADTSGKPEVSEPEKNIKTRFGFSLAPQTPTQWDLVDAFPGTQFHEPVQIVEAPSALTKSGGPPSYAVVGRRGRIWLVDGSKQSLIINLSHRIDQDAHGSDDSLLSMVFSPTFGVSDSPLSRKFYALYTTGKGQNHRYVLSEFQLSTEGLKVTNDSEKILISQPVPEKHHVGGKLLFGKDGFLYISIGDGSGDNDNHGNGQRVDKALFSGILRIDVLKIGGNVSQAISKKPDRGFTQHYFIPKDNPFVGDPGVLEEFWAIGLRNPFRISFDPANDRLIWVGDVGQDNWESIYVASKGSNHGWSFREGNHRFLKSPLKGEKPSEFKGELVSPVFEYSHSDLNNCIIGGVVIPPNSSHPLSGCYIYGDHGSGRIWALRRENAKPQSQELCVVPQQNGRVSGFYWSSDAGLLVSIWKYNSPEGKILKLVESESFDPDAAPELLSKTRLFEDLQTLKPSGALVPYSIRLPFWSDGAIKKRWISLPTDQANDRIKFHLNEPWSFPSGTIFVKHFELEEEGASRLRLETRVIVRDINQGISTYSYKWNARQSDAELVSDRDSIDVITKDSDKFVWKIPSHTDCHICHNKPAGQILGVRTRQVSGVDNQIIRWNEQGWFSDVLSEALLQELPLVSVPHDISSGLETRVRSYLDVNCSYCHMPEVRVNANLDLRAKIGIHDTGLLSNNVLKNYSIPDSAPIVLGDLSRSLLFHRFVSKDPGVIMPPLLHSKVDPAAVTLLQNWILSRSDRKSGSQQYLASARVVDAVPGKIPENSSLFNANHAISLSQISKSYFWGIVSSEQIYKQGDGLHLKMHQANTGAAPVGVRVPCDYSGDFSLFWSMEVNDLSLRTNDGQITMGARIKTRSGNVAQIFVCISQSEKKLGVFTSDKISLSSRDVSGEVAYRELQQPSISLGFVREGKNIFFYEKTPTGSMHCIHSAFIGDEQLSQFELYLNSEGENALAEGAFHSLKVSDGKLFSSVLPKSSSSKFYRNFAIVVSCALLITTLLIKCKTIVR
ncbi:PQQ-dependent sugar dehydrogenase [Gimesia panareensis]|uniref:PQQ-dependent sugar dehydrogenase n=1 Tax=Gimesia panareensis TaxID=2527978 RepID=UPI0011888EDB|nr:PQQ-dependent sugar dehydrogenase [Gimesia panareensis]QDU52140.1 Soluble aldose sugar dehydrogenase YliI precursor [Gimesia panareensis]